MKVLLHTSRCPPTLPRCDVRNVCRIRLLAIHSVCFDVTCYYVSKTRKIIQVSTGIKLSLISFCFILKVHSRTAVVAKHLSRYVGIVVTKTNLRRLMLIARSTVVVTCLHVSTYCKQQTNDVVVIQMIISDASSIFVWLVRHNKNR